MRQRETFFPEREIEHSIVRMDAAPLLGKVAALLHAVKLEAVLIGNAAAALHGSPVTTVDLDFLFRDTPLNLKKLKRMARMCDGVLLRPYYPASQLYRLESDREGMQLDFMPRIDGIRSYPSLRSRSEPVYFGQHSVLVASLPDIIKSKKAAHRQKDLAVLKILEKTLQEKEKHAPKTKATRAP